MRQKVFVQRIECKEDMSCLEQTIGGLLGGEHNKCSLIRCNEFIQLRLRALYRKGVGPIHVYGEGLQISLDENNVATVYLLTSFVEPDEGLLGKRSEPEPTSEPRADSESDSSPRRKDVTTESHLAQEEDPVCIKDMFT